MIHGILAALAFVVLFPLGSIFMRIIPGRFAIWIHALTQLCAYIIYIAAAALGFWMLQEVQIPRLNGGLVSSRPEEPSSPCPIVLHVADQLHSVIPLYSQLPPDHWYRRLDRPILPAYIWPTPPLPLQEDPAAASLVTFAPLERPVDDPAGHCQWRPGAETRGRQQADRHCVHRRHRRHGGGLVHRGNLFGMPTCQRESTGIEGPDEEAGEGWERKRGAKV